MAGTVKDHASRLALALGAATLLAHPAVAQDRTLVRASENTLTMRLVDVREPSTIKDDLERALELSHVLETEVERLEDDLAEAKARVDVKKNEIEIIDTERKLADKQDKEAEKEALERQKDKEELEKELLERYVDLVERQIDLAEAQREVAAAAARVHEEELSFEGASADLTALQGTDDATLDRALRLRNEVESLERDVLEAMRNHARRKEDQAEKERRVIEARLEVIKARGKIQTISD